MRTQFFTPRNRHDSNEAQSVPRAPGSDAAVQSPQSLLDPTNPRQPASDGHHGSPRSRPILPQAIDKNAGLQRPYQPDQCVQHLFEQQTVRTPHNVALWSASGQLSYRQLDDDADRLANYLRRRGAGPEQAVGICLSRSARMWTAVLAVLKSGAAYLPLDPALPPARLESMLQHAAVRLIIMEPSTQSAFTSQSAECVCLDSIERELTAHAGERPHVDVRPDNLAYVLFTSGSTGTAKPIAMPHRPLVNLVTWQTACWAGLPPRRTLQFASLSFDVSFQEAFCTWSSGGTLIVASEEIRRDPRGLLQWLVEQRIERAFLPVVILRQLAEVASGDEPLPATLREIITAGEALVITPAVEHLFQRLPNCRLVNHYGPAETHVVTSYTLPPSMIRASNHPPIGRPIDNVKVYVLDEQGEPAADGRPGELYIGGDAPARGYFGRSDLTVERFLPDRFDSSCGKRMYRTGDYVRWLPSGDLEFLGRRDDQIKIRGHRVELGEIQTTLELHPSVRQGVVLAVDGPQGSKRLVAFVEYLGPQPADASPLMHWLKTRLPDFMVPARMHLLGSLPVSGNGKIDRQALMALDSSPRGHLNCSQARDQVEWRLARIWENLLQVEPLGIDDDFLEMGGDSLLLMELASRVEEQFGRRLATSELLEANTIEKLARILRTSGDDSGWSPLVAIQPRGSRLPLFVVHPGGGNALCYVPLARELGRKQPLYALEAAGVDGLQPPATSIEVMAAQYIAAIRRVQPVGPYALAGWSFGGTVAYEMACQLQTDHEQTALLAIIDAGLLYAFGVMRAIFPQGELGLFDLLRLPPQEQIDRFRERTAAAELIPPQADPAQAERIYRVFLANAQAILDYRPSPYAGRIDLFLGKEKLAASRHDPFQEWKRLCPNVTLHWVPGNHLNLVHEPYVKVLADKLRECLEHVDFSRTQ